MYYEAKKKKKFKEKFLIQNYARKNCDVKNETNAVQSTNEYNII